MTTQASASRSEYFALAAVVGATALVRLGLAQYSLWFDELASVFFASQPLHRLWSVWMIRETNPPLYYSLLRLWIACVGQGVVRLRALSVLAAMAAMIVTWFGLRRFYGPPAALTAVAMMGVSARHLYFALEVRSYMLLYLAVSMSFFALLRIAATDGTRGTRRAWTVYIGGSVAAAYLHTTGMLWPIAGTIALMIANPAYRRWRGGALPRLIAADLTIAVGAGWWIGITFLQLGMPNGDIGWMRPTSPAEDIWTLRTTILLTQGGTGVWQSISFAVGVLALFGALTTWRRATTRFAIACCVLSCAIFLGANRLQPILQTRTVFWISIFPLVLAAAGVSAIVRQRIAAGVAVLIVGLLSVDFVRSVPTLQNEDWITPVVRAARDPGAIVLVDGEAMSVVLDTACRVELNRSRCPFPIAVIAGSGPDYSHWAAGFARGIGNTGGRLTLPSATTRAYLMRRRSQDPLVDLHRVGLLRHVPLDSGAFVGPLPQAFVRTLAERSYVADGDLRLACSGQNGAYDAFFTSSSPPFSPASAIPSCVAWR